MEAIACDDGELTFVDFRSHGYDDVREMLDGEYERPDLKATWKLRGTLGWFGVFSRAKETLDIGGVSEAERRWLNDASSCDVVF